jgi:hypothetical protein
MKLDIRSELTLGHMKELFRWTFFSMKQNDRRRFVSAG